MKPRITFGRYSTVAGVFISLLYIPVQAQMGEVLERTLNVHGTERTYLLYVPTEYDGTSDWPLVLVYHGFQMTASMQMGYDKLDVAADEARVLVAYPQGLRVTDLVFGGRQFGWNIPENYNADHDDVAFTYSLIDDIGIDFAVDRNCIYATGYSNGSEMAMYLACVMSDRIASVAGVGGGLTKALLETCQPGRPISVLKFFGTADEYTPIDGNDRTPPIVATPSYFASFNNCSAVPTETDLPDLAPDDGCTVSLLEYDQCDPDIEVLFYRFQDGGHTWPGSDGRWSFLGPTNQDIDASALMLEFFARNPRPESDGQLVNISQRGYIGPNSRAMITGFVVTGAHHAAFLIRGVGPSLETFGVPSPLVDPVIQIHRITDEGAELIAENDDWTGEVMMSVAESLGAFPLWDGSLDTALRIQLVPGIYTVTLTGKDGAEGAAMIEVYQVQ